MEEESSDESEEYGQYPKINNFTGKDWGKEAIGSCLNYLQNQSFPDWHLKAACAGMEMEAFFGKEEGPGKKRHRPTLNMREVREARAICDSCPVKWDCLEHAINNDEEFGVWGGTTGRERRRLKQAKNKTVVLKLLSDVGLPVDEDE